MASWLLQNAFAEDDTIQPCRLEARPGVLSVLNCKGNAVHAAIRYFKAAVLSGRLLRFFASLRQISFCHLEVPLCLVAVLCSKRNQETQQTMDGLACTSPISALVAFTSASFLPTLILSSPLDESSEDLVCLLLLAFGLLRDVLPLCPVAVVHMPEITLTAWCQVLAIAAKGFLIFDRWQLKDPSSAATLDTYVDVFMIMRCNSPV